MTDKKKQEPAVDPAAGNKSPEEKAGEAPAAQQEVAPVQPAPASPAAENVENEFTDKPDSNAPVQQRTAPRDTLLVLGMHRSGTSAFTGVFERLGAENAAHQLTPDNANPKGYGESRMLMRFHDRLLSEAGSRWDDWSQFNPLFKHSHLAARMGTKLRHIVDQEYRDADLIVVKDPRICRFADFWINQLEAGADKVQIAIVIRNPLEVAMSLAARDGIEISRGLLLWLRHVLDAEQATRGRKRVFVGYQDLLEDWQKTVKLVTDELAIAWPRRSPSVELEISEFLERKLRRQRVDDAHSLEASIVPGWVRDAFAVFSEVLETGSLTGMHQARLDLIRDAFNAASEVFAPVITLSDSRLERLGEFEGLISDHLKSEDSDDPVLEPLYDLISEALDPEADKIEAFARLRNYQFDQLDVTRQTAEMQREHDEALKRVAELMEALKERDAQLDELRTELQREWGDTVWLYEQQALAAQDEVCKLNADLDAALASAEAARQALAEQKAISEQVNERVDDLERGLKSAAVENKRLQVELKRVRERLDLERQAPDASRQDSQYATELRSEVARLDQENKKLKSEVERVSEQERALQRRLFAASSAPASANRQAEAGGDPLDPASPAPAAPASELTALDKKSHAVLVAWQARPNGASIRKADRKRVSGPLFDPVYYSAQLERLGINIPDDPLDHFYIVGARAGLNPHPLFDTRWYLDQNPDVKKSGVNPLVHYFRSGEREGRFPHPFFNPEFYASQNPDVARAGMNMLSHYLSSGWKEGRDPNLFFYSSWYLAQNSDVKAAGICPLVHYAITGELEGRRPHPSFDPNWYRENRLSGSQGRSPLRHYLLEGHTESGAIRATEPDYSGKRRKTLLMVAHSAGDKLFGAERSFLDVVAAVDRERYRVLVVLPAPHSSYVELISQFADQVHFFRRAWWENGNGNRPDVLARYATLIEQESVDIVYSNTIMLSEPQLAARKAGLPSVCHVREAIQQDEDLQKLVGMNASDIITQVCERSSYMIANSVETARQFGQHSNTFQIYNAVRVQDYDIPSPMLDGGRPLIVGMVSSNIAKKGIAEIATLARGAEAEGLNVRFRLIGPITKDVEKLQAECDSGKGPNNIDFPGYLNNAREAIASLDVVVNFSLFAESFGRTIAEASAARRPVIVFNHGALPEVVDDGVTGYIIPYRDPLAALPHLRRLIAEPDLLARMGEAGHARASELFSTEVLKEKVNIALDVIARGGTVHSEDDATERPATAPVSVILPNYNYENYLPERINSILAQTVKPAEIIFLDDNSPDGSVGVARKLLEASDIPHRIVANKENRGVYRQWITGVEMASQPWVWIAEADDRCEPDFIESLIAYAADDVNLIYAQSQKIDGEGKVTAADNRAHSNDVSKTRWNQDYVTLGVREVTDALVYRNIIPNASAALLRKSAIAGMEEKLQTMKYTGDWMLYCHMLRQGKVAFVSRPLNHFRRHAQTVTSTKGKTVEYLSELARIREYFTSNFPVTPAQVERMNWFLDRDYKIDGVARNSEAEEIQPILDAAKSHTLERMRIGFITTNNGSYYGGSEMLWREAAIALRQEGHDVFAVIKKWEPRPEFFDELEAAGVTLLFKEESGFDGLLAAEPDLTVVSIGDQDEGIEYYEPLRNKGLPYVIVNQLTKEARFWPIRKEKTAQVKAGYAAAQKAFFTCWNNHRVMESRLGTTIDNAAVHFNPYHIDRSHVPAWPSSENGLQVAIPSKLLFIHKGQDLLVDVAKKPEWKNRTLTFNFYGIGPDEERLRSMASDAGIENFVLHGRVNDIAEIWRDNHALLMPSRMEGLPIMLVSAMLSARVPILTDIGGHAEVVDDGVSGFIAANPSVDDLEEALQRAYDARDRWQAIGQAARRDILAFLPEHPVADFLHKLRETAGQARASAAE